jgi:hypothetical protein
VTGALPGDPVVITGEGTHTLTHRAFDGLLWTDWVQDTVRIDSTAPDNTTVAPSTDWQKGPVSVTVQSVAETGDKAPLQPMWKVDAGGWTLGTAATVSGTGPHTLTTRVEDAAGNAEELAFPLKIDDALPVDSTTVPVGWQQDQATITLKGSDADSGVDHIEYQIDGGGSVQADPDDDITVGANGAHTLTTVVVDNAGNESAPKDQDFYVDSAGPDDLTTVPTGWVTVASSTLVTVEGADTSGSGIARTEWELTDMTTGVTVPGDVAGPGPVLVGVSGNGVHRLRTRLTDGKGHYSTGSASSWLTQYVRIDTVKPTDTTNEVSGWVKQSTLDVTVGGSDAHSGVAQVEWRLNGVLGTAAGASHVVTVPEGVNTLETRVVDNADNHSDWDKQTISLDATGPVNQTPLNTSVWRNTPYSVALAADDGGGSGVDRLKWRVDGGAITEGGTATVSGHGKHTLSTWAVDELGNEGTPRDEDVWIDTVKPADATDYATPVGRGHKVVFTGTDADSGVASIQWSLDGGAPQTGPSVRLKDAGTHTITTTVRDNAGNVTDPVTHTVVVKADMTYEDTEKPVDTTAAPTGWQSAPYTLQVTGEDDLALSYMQWRGEQEGQGNPNGSVSFTTEGVHEVETRAVDMAGLTSDFVVRRVKIDLTNPTDTTALPPATKTPSITLSGHDATSGVASVEYTINGAPGTAAVTPGADGNASATIPLAPATEGEYTVTHRVVDAADRVSAWKTDVILLDTTAPTNASGTAPTGWQQSISLPLTGDDTAGSGYDHGEWRIDGGAPESGTTAEVTLEGTHTLETRAVDKAGNTSAWSTPPQTVKIDHTKPLNTTPAISSAWRRTNFSTTVTGTDPTSGVDRVEWRLGSSGTPSATPAVSLTADGVYALQSRVVDLAGNDSGWRTDAVRIDKTAPALAVDCGGDGWRNTPAVCAVNADGGVSGLPTLTATRDGASPDTVSGGQFVVDADGAFALSFRAVDGAGNETVRSAAVKIDRTPPSAAVSCSPGGGLTWVCSGSGSDGGSGVQVMRYSVDGAVAALPGNGSFVALKGTVVVSAVDAAGNVGSSAPITLTDRTPPPPPPVVTPPAETVTARTVNEAVYLKRRARSSSQLVGQLTVAATPTRTTVDLRPLALGRGRFRFVVKVKSAGRKTKTVRKTVHTRKGYSLRIRVRTRAAARTRVTVSIKRRTHRRWRTYPTGRATLD